MRSRSDMELESFVVTIEKFLLLQEEREDDNEEKLFSKDIRQYSIPLYQREYEWEDTRVKEFIQDIAKRDKFLGIVILNRGKNSYEIIDGQQRITTIILLLAALFNKMGSDKNNLINLEQSPLLKYLMKDDKIVLINESIGDWLYLKDNKICLWIDENKDIYHQKGVFTKRWSEIEEKIAELPGRDFIKNLLACQVLVLICNSLRKDSPEQIFMDMNDKLKRLDSEAIFKGHCFNICHSDHHNLLKKKWIDLKSNYFKLEGWGCKNFSTFIYHYVLCLKGYEKVNKDLMIGDKHILENKTDDDIIGLLDDMISYSKNLSIFKENLKIETYRFEDICPDVTRYRNVDITVIKDMFRYILEYGKDQYYKFPLMMLINYLEKTPSLNAILTLSMLKRIISNYYVYSYAFINRVGKKDKSYIDRSIFELLNKEERDFDPILAEVKRLRKENIKMYSLADKFNKEQSFALYSIIDNFDVKSSSISKIYNLRNEYNDEHFVINDNKRNNVVWINIENKEKNIKLDDYFSRDYLSKCKDIFVNYLIIPKTLNEQLESYDIVTKINCIESYYITKNNEDIPKHISVFFQHIKGFSTYKKLVDMKILDTDNEENKEKINCAYKDFVEAYFDDAALAQLKDLIQRQLLKTFEN